MSTHNICFRGELRKVLCGLPLFFGAMNFSRIAGESRRKFQPRLFVCRDISKGAFITIILIHLLSESTWCLDDVKQKRKTIMQLHLKNQ